MNDPINRDAMRLAVQLYAIRSDLIENEGRGADVPAHEVDTVIEDARELILANRKLQRLTKLNESEAIFQRLSQLMASYEIKVRFTHDATTQSPMIRLTGPTSSFTVPL